MSRTSRSGSTCFSKHARSNTASACETPSAESGSPAANSSPPYAVTGSPG